MTIITVIHTLLQLKRIFFALRLTAGECEETFRNGVIKLAGFCTAPYGAAVPEKRWNSQPLGSPLRQLCRSRNCVCCLGEINLYFCRKIITELSQLIRGGGAKLSKDSNKPSKNA